MIFYLGGICLLREEYRIINLQYCMYIQYIHTMYSVHNAFISRLVSLANSV